MHFYDSLNQPLMPTVRKWFKMSQRGEPLTLDGDIIKLEISPAPPSTPLPLWTKGSNALLHYKVYAYVPERKTAPDTHVHSSTCSHGHKAHSHSALNESKRKVDSLMELVEKAKNGKGACERECDAAPILTRTWTGEHQGCSEQSGCNDTTETREETSQKEEVGKPKRQFISDSRAYALDGKKPFELRIGREFIVKAMEICVKSMRPSERARFLCMNEYVDVRCFNNSDLCSAQNSDAISETGIR